MPITVHSKGQHLLDITDVAGGTGPAVPATVVRKDGQFYLMQSADGRQRLVDPVMLLPDTEQYRAEARAHYERLHAAFGRGRVQRRARIRKLEGELASLRADEARDPG